MRIRALVHPVLLLAALLPMAARAQVTSKPDPERAAVQQVITQLGEYMQAGNLDAADKLIRPRSHILTATAQTHGWAEYREKVLQGQLAKLKAGYAHAGVEATVHGDLAYASFRRVFGKAGGPQTDGRGTAVLQKVNGQWLIVQLQLAE